MQRKLLSLDRRWEEEKKPVGLSTQQRIIKNRWEKIANGNRSGNLSKTSLRTLETGITTETPEAGGEEFVGVKE